MPSPAGWCAARGSTPPAGVATTGGHADPRNGINASLTRALGYPGPEDGVVAGPVEARTAVRQRYKEGSDVIKITATGGVLSYAKNGQNPQFMLDEIQAITSTARDYGFKVAAHARRRGHPPRLRGRGRLDRARHLHERRHHRRDEEERHTGTCRPSAPACSWARRRASRATTRTAPSCRPKALAVGPPIRRPSRAPTRPGSRSPSAPTPACSRTARTRASSC